MSSGEEEEVSSVLGFCKDLFGSHLYFPVPVRLLSFVNRGGMGVCRVLAAHYGLPPSSSGGVTSPPLPASAVVSASPDPLSCEGR